MNSKRVLVDQRGRSVRQNGTGGIAHCKFRRLTINESSFKDALEVMSMRAQHCRAINEQGIEEAHQMEFLAEKGHKSGR